MNGIFCMMGIGVLNVLYFEILLVWVIVLFVMVNELVQVYDDFFFMGLNFVKKYVGQQQVVFQMCDFFFGSSFICKCEELFVDDWEQFCFEFIKKIQEYYFICCVF